MSLVQIATQLLVLLFVSTSAVGGQEIRIWTDNSGHYKFQAELIAFSESKVVLQKTNNELIAIGLEDLSEDDREYLKSNAAEETVASSAEGLHTWTMQSGLKVPGRIVDFGEREVKLKKYAGKIMVNDRVFSNLPPVYQQMIPKIVAHFEKTEILDFDGLKAWFRKQKDRTKSYTCQGVLLELANGDQYAVPLFLFSNADQAALRPSWQRWEAAKQDEQLREQESFYLRAQSQAAAQAAEETREDAQQMRQIAQVQLRLQAYNSGLFDLWEVQMIPPNGSVRMAAYVVVPGRNSNDARAKALDEYPNYRVGSIAKVRRKW